MITSPRVSVNRTESQAGRDVYEVTLPAAAREAAEARAVAAVKVERAEPFSSVNTVKSQKGEEVDVGGFSTMQSMWTVTVHAR